MMDQLKKFLLFLAVFFFGFFLFFLKPQTIKALTCNNGPNNNDGGGCGSPCHCGNPWTLYNKDLYGAQYCQTIDVDVGGFPSFITAVSEICPTGNVCRLGETGLRPGYCDCTFGPIYKTCCVGSTPVLCERYPGYPEVYQKGRCPAGSTMVDGTSCGSSPPPPGGGGSCGVVPYNNACPKGYVLSSGCCYCP